MIDVRNMSNKALYDLMNDVNRELEKRKCEREKELWKNFVEALKAYTDEFSYIDVDYGSGETYFQGNEDFSEIGKIQ